ncbi:acetyltransferase [Paenibacillus sp. PR3]|uniref:Acetyltransferase n=1 Tax=Paenibacillus terricola TaxID=2763503 RepID=A0ABR8N1M6_9BACL|nr:acetyltransferase [Paenibacillus terricola]MBD3920699.1 acetyltransferase [Paenibacillus terricola]
MNTPIIVLGAGGHAKVCVDLLLRQGRTIIGYAGPVSSDWMEQRGIHYIGEDAQVAECDARNVTLVNGIGMIGQDLLRSRIFNHFRSQGYTFETIIHDSAIVSSDVELEEGVHIMAGAIVQAGSTIGVNTIINTRSSLDHDCRIGAHVHISPGAVLCGGAVVGDSTHLGASATIIQNVTVGVRCVVGAGSVVLKPVADDKLVYGVPAKEAKK